MSIGREIFLPAEHYNLSATLQSGQAFRWRRVAEAWEGVIGNRWVRLESEPHGIRAFTAVPIADSRWVAHYLQTEVNLDAILQTFPDDPPLREAVRVWHGLRLLRQDPWECLASFICSSTKQIVQIQQIVEQLCRCFGDPIPVPSGHPETHAFPSAVRLADTTESRLRGCKMGFRAPYVLAAARAVATGGLDLKALESLPLENAREQLMNLPGVGRKIADCVLLFAYGFQQAFPVDVWVLRALRELYFPRRRPTPKRLREFSQTHFGPNAGYAQQYLFHFMRMRGRVSQAGLGVPTERHRPR